MAWDDDCLAMVAEMGLGKTVDVLRRIYGMGAVTDAVVANAQARPTDETPPLERSPKWGE